MFELRYPGYEEFTWVLQDEHGPSSTPPLLEGGNVRPPSRVDSAGRPTTLLIHGFTYSRAGSIGGSGFGPSGEPQTVADLTSWRQEWLPQVARVVAMLEAFNPATVAAGGWQLTLEEQVLAYERAYAGVHRSSAIPAGRAASRFSDAYCSRFGDESRARSEALLQGLPNLSTSRAVALWDLSRELRAGPGIISALRSGEVLPEDRMPAPFRKGYAAMIAAYGHTTNADLQDLPTWREDPAIPMAVILAYALQEEERSPRLIAERQRHTRLALEAELLSLSNTDPEIAALLPLLAMAQQLVPNQEDHNLLVDQRMEAASRARWLAVGRHLHGGGLVQSPDDVFYLYRDELVAALEGEKAPDKALLAARREDLRQARSVPPPPVLGRPRETSSTGESPRVLRGVAASPGRYRGRARVIERLEDAGRLLAGEVMVSRSTTPTWTPFFGVAGALVTNSGSALSHSAIVAREFGIPAVVATGNATELVPDGALITVDGTRGLVLIEG